MILWFYFVSCRFPSVISATLQHRNADYICRQMNARAVTCLSTLKDSLCCVRSLGLREDYAEMIQLCRNCRCLFWKSIGHPCIVDQDPDYLEKLENVDKSSLHVPIPPHAFLKFFSLWFAGRICQVSRWFDCDFPASASACDLPANVVNDSWFARE